MSRFTEPQYEPLLEKLRAHLRQERYGCCARVSYPYAARCFLRYLERRGWEVESVTSAQVDRYLQSLRRRGSRGPFPKQYRRMHAAAIRMLLRQVCGRWPPPQQPRSAKERADQQIIEGYDTWMTELRGLSPQTRRHGRAEARRLLSWMREHKRTAGRLTVADLDAYLALRSRGKRRTGIAEMVSVLRGVLRHLHRSGLMPRDLSGELQGPPLYALEGIPSVIRAEDVREVLSALKQDHTVVGRRDHAIWRLLVSYGLRAGEIKALQLTDIDWRGERLRIRHAKTGAYSELPLLRAPAEALLSYLRQGRPASASRAVFLRAQAPYVGLALNTSLQPIVLKRLAAVGVKPVGRCGPHALRHARAVSLLRGGVPLKVIGDVLGHRSERSTAVYLKLATEDLRAVALDVPAQVRTSEVAL
jgi:site-specific recombinase XerD